TPDRTSPHNLLRKEGEYACELLLLPTEDFPAKGEADAWCFLPFARGGVGRGLEGRAKRFQTSRAERPRPYLPRGAYIIQVHHPVFNMEAIRRRETVFRDRLANEPGDMSARINLAWCLFLHALYQAGQESILADLIATNQDNAELLKARWCESLEHN